MTASPPDPDPTETPALTDGGGVDPGDTPPDSGQTSASANQDPPPRRALSPMSVAAMIGVAVVFAIFLVVAVVYFLQVMGVMDRW